MLKVHKVFKHELCTFITREWAFLARLKSVMPVEVALQRIFTAENVLSFMQGQPNVADAMQTLERLTLK